jgi:hypothetical protein
MNGSEQGRLRTSHAQPGKDFVALGNALRGKRSALGKPVCLIGLFGGQLEMCEPCSAEA